ncbi:MAG: GNAT family N-acetyltransferase [Oxalobacteraceae bacterium]
MTSWQFREVPFKFQLSDWTLFSVTRFLQVRSETMLDGTSPVHNPMPASDALEARSQGFSVHALPVTAKLPTVSSVDGYLRYVALQYRHCYINLGLSFDDYQKKFSSKTRSTIIRKIKKFAEHCGGSLAWKTYRTQPEMREFFQCARTISRKTYQERLLDAGIPDSEEFVGEMEALAAEDRVRAYVLFDGDRPVSYLYCPARDDVLVYAYLGYDPDYMKMSVGTVLQWLAVEQLFAEARFRFFDFTEGESEHKRLFATDDVLCANIFFLRRNFGNIVLIHAHLFMGQFSRRLGDVLENFGVKAKIKRLLRF